MKLRFLYFLFISTLALVLLTANKNGRAAQSNAGNTGAPGDEAAPNGVPRTCVYCHFGAALTSTTALAVLDSSGQAVGQYVPGQQYTARLAITSPNAQGFGFQMIALRDSDNADLDGFADAGTNNYKLSTISTPVPATNGRTYAEHDNVSTPSVFNVSWTAPAAGTGPVTFYASGNAVNKDGFSSGDGPSNAPKVHLTEAQASAAGQPAALPASVRPTVLSEDVSVQITVSGGGAYHFRVFDRSGNEVGQTTMDLAPGSNRLTLPMDGQPAGMYFLVISQGARSITIKLLKL